MLKRFIKLLLCFAITTLTLNSFAQIQVPVTKAGFMSGDWEVSQTNKTAAGEVRNETSLVFLRCNPLVPVYTLKPGLHAGSVYFSLVFNNPDPNISGVTPDATITKIRLRSKKFDVPLIELATLKYSTYSIPPFTPPGSPVTLPAVPVATRLILQIDTDANGTADGSIIYEPSSQPATRKLKEGTVYTHKVKFNEWQEWNVLKGVWTAMPATLYTGATSFTIDEFIAQHNKAKIINTDPMAGPNTGPGVRFTVPALSGYYDYRGYVDAFTIRKKKLVVSKNHKHWTYGKSILYDFSCAD